MREIGVFAAGVFFLFAQCGCGEKATTLDEYYTRVVTLPGGQKIRAEVVVHQTDMARGMMFRDSLEPGRGMLFMHARPGNHTYWMYQVKIPLDIIWMDSERTIVEISPDTPPCRTKASECPHYGGTAVSQYVLELAGGSAAKYGLRIGDRLTF